MKRFARIAAPVGAALVALVLAIGASATTSKSDRSASPTASQAVTNYLTYVHGTRGKADPKKSKVYIGWVNQQGGQVVIGGLATAGAQLAVKYVNDVLGGVGGHPVALVNCFIKSNEEEGTTCGQKLVQRQADHRGRGGRSRHGRPVASRDDRRYEADSHGCRHHPGRRSVRRPASSSSATARTSSCRSATTRRRSSTRRPRRSSTRTLRASRSRDR